MLREKTVLLDEVHHRVENNLQVITSLLSLQARTAPPEARAALAECRNRVHAMALTRQLLHENADVARLGAFPDARTARPRHARPHPGPV